MQIKTIFNSCAISVSTLFLCSCLSWFTEGSSLPEKEQQREEPVVIESTAPGLADRWTEPGEPAPYIPKAEPLHGASWNKSVKESALEGENRRVFLRGAQDSRTRINAGKALPTAETPLASRPGAKEAEYREVVAQIVGNAWASTPEAAAQWRLSSGRKTNSVELILHLTPDGKVAAAAVQKSSGSVEKDRAILRTVRSLKRLPPPPSGAGPVHLTLDI